MAFDELYREMLMDHYRNPQNRGSLDNASAKVHLNNPLCGDEIDLYILEKDGIVHDAQWGGQGCSISQAAASMMSQAVKGLSVEDAYKLVANFQKLMHGKELPYSELDLEDLEALSGVAQFPVRIKCALLPFEALNKALNEVHGE